MKKEYMFTSESVSEGHPDKVADQISDAILDAYLSVDPYSKVACETLVTKNRVILAGEIKSDGSVDADAIVRETIQSIGYDDPSVGFSYDTVEITNLMHEQAQEIRQGVDRQDGSIGAGDQGLMFGYAVNETPELMPIPIMLAHKLVMRQAELRKSRVLSWLRPDAKSQVTMRYIDGKPVSVEKVVISTQHSPEISQSSLREAVVEEIIKRVIPTYLLSPSIEYFVNPTGSFIEGGPAADTGLTGRKIIVDTYGGACPHGGGAFSGKDATKVDRSGAYMARYVAKNIVAAGLTQKCLVQVSFVIGKSDPTSLMIDAFGIGEEEERKIEERIKNAFAFTPKEIIDQLDLRRPIFRKTAAYGHFGTNIGLPWEQVVQI
jgi:S-adenosylmethionine synthetase